MVYITSLSAQDYAFRVIGTKGSNTVDGSGIKVGMKLSQNQIVKIANNGSYLGLIHKTGKTLELQNKGAYPVKALESKLKKSGNLNSRYARFVVNELNKGGNLATARGSHMKKTGSVSRDVSKVRIQLPESSDLYGSTAALRWFLAEGSVNPDDIKEYKVYVTNMEDDVLHTQVTAQDFAFVDLSDQKFQENGQLIFKVVGVKHDGTVTDNLGDITGKMIQILDKEEKSQMKKDMNEFESNTNSPLTKLAEASYYEEKELYSDAIRAYEQALELSGNVDSFQKMYDSFLGRVSSK